MCMSVGSAILVQAQGRYCVLHRNFSYIYVYECRWHFLKTISGELVKFTVM